MEKLCTIIHSYSVHSSDMYMGQLNIFFSDVIITFIFFFFSHINTIIVITISVTIIIRIHRSIFKIVLLLLVCSMTYPTCFYLPLFLPQVHVNLMLMEARQQAELLYALRALNSYLT